jgi:uncharacterized protein (DUF1330 family)
MTSEGIVRPLAGSDGGGSAATIHEGTDLMPAYALAHLRTPQINDEVLEYIERIQDTMDPFGGRFIVHGAEVDVKEGPWPGTVVIIEFPDVDAAQAWYASPAYQEILPLRTDNIDASTIVVAGVPTGYDPRVTAARLRAAAAG